MPWNLITLVHGQLAQCSLPLPKPFTHSDLHFHYSGMHFPELCLPNHHKLPYKQHSLQPHCEGESLPPLCTLLVLIRTKKWCHPSETNMFSKCKHTKEDGQQTSAGQYPFIALLVHIQANANIALFASKHNTSISLLQGTFSFYWDNALMHNCPKRCQSHGIFGKSNALNNILSFQRKFKCGSYSYSAIKLRIQPSELIKKHAHKCPIQVQAISMIKCLKHKPLLGGSSHSHIIARKAFQTMRITNHILSHMHECANWCHETSLLLSMDNWLNAVCHCQSHLHTLTFIFTTLACISLNYACPIITNYLTSSIHFSPIVKENLYHLFAPFLCWYVQRSGAILSETNMFSKCKHTKEDGQQTSAGQYPFIALLVHIQANANIALFASKHNTSISLLQGTFSFYWDNALMHNCPKRCQSHGMFGKSNALNNIFAFKENSSAVSYSNSAIKLPIQPSELIKKHAHKCPIPNAGHLHDKMLQTQTTSLGSSHTHMTARKACQTMCIINHILSHMHGCANWCHETSLTLSMDNWLNAVCHCQCHSHNLTFISTTLTCISSESRLSIHHKLPYKQHSLQPHSEGESLPPPYAHSCADMYKGVSCLPEESNMVSKCKHTKQDGQQKNAWQYPFIALLFTFKKMQTQHWLCQSITHLPACSRKHALSIGTTHWRTNVPKDAQLHGMFGKSNALKNILCFQRQIEVPSILKLSNKASYSTLWTHQKTCTQVPHP